MDTAVHQGRTAAARAARFIARATIERPSTSAVVDPQLCTGCAQCVETCAFDAIQMLPPLAHIDPFLCLACGNCVAACPSKAIDLPGASDAQIYAQIDAALARRGDGETRSLIFACSWSGFAAMELAGARRMAYPATTRVVELPCSARLDPLHVLYALLHGADRVTLALCPPGECHYGQGNQFARARLETLRAQLAAHGIAPDRVRSAQMMGDDATAWVATARLN
jgi:heterodisulfide reductase subunit A